MKDTARKYLVTIGTFDGVHLGHRKLMQWVLSEARRKRMNTRVVFFVAPPHFYFRPDHRVPLLTGGRERRAIVKSLGVDRVSMLRFGPRWAQMTHTRFFEEYIVKRWKAGGVLVGRDFAFGAGRKGDLRYLRQVCRKRGMSVGVLPLVRVEGRKISSSRIRQLLLKGDVGRAALMLGREYSLQGRVIRGRGMGRKLGFPTANLRVPPEVLQPPGVFHVRVLGLHGAPGSQTISKGARHGAPAGDAAPAGVDAVCNVGLRPTVGGRARRPTVEVHIPGWSRDLYGKTLRIEFLRRIRGERKFASLAALRRAIRKDIESIA